MVAIPKFPKMNELWKLTLCSALTGLTLSYHTGVLGVCMVPMREHFLISEAKAHSITASNTSGTILGSLISTFLLWSYAPKAVILTGNVLSTIGSLLMAFSPVISVYVIGRFLFGTGLGLSYLSSTIFLAHWAPSKMRGKLLAVFGIMSAAGQFLSLLSGQIFLKVTIGWRIMLFISAIPCVLQIFCMARQPESPRFLAQHGDLDLACDGIRRVLHPDDAAHLIQLLNFYPQKNQFLDSIKISWASRTFRKSFCVNAIVQASQHLAGLNLVSYGINSFKKKSTMSSFDKLLISSLSPILGSVLTVFIVDVKVIGRRYALLLSLGVVILCLFILGLSFSETKVTTEDPGNVIVLGLLEIHLVLHSLGLKSLPYILNVELQLFRFSELGAGIGAVVGWLIHLLVSTTNESLLKDLGWNGAFFLSAFVSTVMLIVLAFILPETQGLELEEVEKLFLF